MDGFFFFFFFLIYAIRKTNRFVIIFEVFITDLVHET
jgi:hypothetical protein